MKLEPASVQGSWVVDLERFEDQRGWFARTFCRDELASRGIEFEVVQANTSFNERPGTLRGLHYQEEPHAETKVVRCTRGAIWDVIVDIRPRSPTFLRWHAEELTADSGRSLLIPEGVAHGFQTLVAASEVEYLMSHRYVAAAARGVRWDDPAFGIGWPQAPDGRVISERDTSFPDFAP